MPDNFFNNLSNDIASNGGKLPPTKLTNSAKASINNNKPYEAGLYITIKENLDRFDLNCNGELDLIDAQIIDSINADTSEIKLMHALAEEPNISKVAVEELISIGDYITPKKLNDKIENVKKQLANSHQSYAKNLETKLTYLTLLVLRENFIKYKLHEAGKNLKEIYTNEKFNITSADLDKEELKYPTIFRSEIAHIAYTLLPEIKEKLKIKKISFKDHVPSIELNSEPYIKDDLRKLHNIFISARQPKNAAIINEISNKWRTVDLNLDGELNREEIDLIRLGASPNKGITMHALDYLEDINRDYINGKDYLISVIRHNNNLLTKVQLEELIKELKTCFIESKLLPTYIMKNGRSIKLPGTKAASRDHVLILGYSRLLRYLETINVKKFNQIASLKEGAYYRDVKIKFDTKVGSDNADNYLNGIYKYKKLKDTYLTEEDVSAAAINDTDLNEFKY